MPKTPTRGVPARVFRANAVAADRVFDLISKHGEPLTTRFIARKLKISSSHAHRVIDQLWRERAIKAIPLDGCGRGRPAFGYVSYASARKKRNNTLDAAS